MRKFVVSFFALVTGTSAFGQNPATTLSIANRNIFLPCGTACTSIQVQAPHIKQADDYVITRPDFIPFDYVTATGNELTSIYTDDVFSDLIPLPFEVCFYGASYNSLVMGSNALITFDATNANTDNSWPLTNSGGSGTPVQIPYAGGTQNSSFSTYYPKASIMGPYHDIYPTSNGSGLRKIEWRIEGTAPKRRFIGSYYSVPMFSCTSTYATSEIVIYEGTGIVEVYVKDKPVCTGWNQGLAILGLQNFDRDKAVWPEGKNCTAWGTANMDSCYRFIPSAGLSRFKSAVLVVNGNIVANADTSTASPGVLNLNFPNVCPAFDSTTYEVRVTFGDCSGNPANDVVFTDTVFVTREAAPSFIVTKTDADCTSGGSIQLTGSGGSMPYEFSIDGGSSWQTTAQYNNLPAGNYQASIRTAGSACIQTAQPVTINLVNNLSFTVGNGGSICRGASFIPTLQGNATSYSWSPATGVSNSTTNNPVLSPQNTTQYTVTATLGNCTQQQSLTVTVYPGATANAGPDKIILSGDEIQLQGTATTGSYLWLPATGLSANNILNPKANPQTTTTYVLEVTSPQGCTATDDVTITVVPYCIKPMEAFTPNGDGINDLWLVTNGTGCLTSAKAEVFNRYGAKVFESTNYQNNWNGTYKGKSLPDGTYYFIITYKLINGKTEFLKGNVTILR